MIIGMDIHIALGRFLKTTGRQPPQKCAILKFFGYSFNTLSTDMGDVGKENGLTWYKINMSVTLINHLQLLSSLDIRSLIKSIKYAYTMNS